MRERTPNPLRTSSYLGVSRLDGSNYSQYSKCKIQKYCKALNINLVLSYGALSYTYGVTFFPSEQFRNLDIEKSLLFDCQENAQLILQFSDASK